MTALEILVITIALGLALLAALYARRNAKKMDEEDGDYPDE